MRLGERTADLGCAGAVTTTPPKPDVPITVFGPITSVVPAAVLLFVIVRLLPVGNSRLPWKCWPG